MATSARDTRFPPQGRRDMVGRNFWAVADADGWVVYEEGLPDRTTRHADRDQAWAVANARAAELKGEAFLQEADGSLLDRRNHRDFPLEMKP
jgi:regulator of RNase E activity RraA